MSYYNVWMAFSEAAITEFKARRSEPDEYDGPMDKTTFDIMSKMADLDVVQRLFKETDPIGGKKYKLFSMVIRGNTVPAKAAIDYITAEWPTHIIMIGAWHRDGRQAGTQWNEDHTDVTGTPVYPVHAQAWRVMPDVVTYDDEGVELSRTPATSNADLRDINLLAGQEPRIFQ